MSICQLNSNFCGRDVIVLKRKYFFRVFVLLFVFYIQRKVLIVCWLDWLWRFNKVTCVKVTATYHHVVKSAKIYTEKLKCEVLPNPPYYPDIAPSDLHLFWSKPYCFSCLTFLWIYRKINTLLDRVNVIFLT